MLVERGWGKQKNIRNQIQNRTFSYLVFNAIKKCDNEKILAFMIQMLKTAYSLPCFFSHKKRMIFIPNVYKPIIIPRGMDYVSEFSYFKINEVHILLHYNKKK